MASIADIAGTANDITYSDSVVEDGSTTSNAAFWNSPILEPLKDAINLLNDVVHAEFTENEALIATAQTDIDGFPDALKNLSLSADQVTNLKLVTYAQMAQITNMGTNTINLSEWTKLANGTLAITLSDETTSAYQLIFKSDSDSTVLTADKTLTFDVNNGDHTIDIAGDLTIPAGGFSNLFFDLTDSPAAATTDGAIYVADNTNSQIDESTVILTESANAFTLTKGTANVTMGAAGSINVAAAKTVDINDDITVDGAATVDQDYTVDAGPTFANLVLTPAVATALDVVQITPSAAIGAVTWKGVDIDGSALDPSATGASVYGFYVDFNTVDLTNDPKLEGIRVKMPDSYTGEEDHCAADFTGNDGDSGRRIELISNYNDAIHIWGEAHIDFTTGTGVAAEYTAIDIVVDASSQNAASETHALDVAISGELVGDVVAVGTHTDVDVIHQHVGAFASHGANYAGRWTGGTYSTGSYTDNIDSQTLFVANNDGILIGSASKFDEIQIIMGTAATKTVSPEFYYLITGSGKTQFYPADDTEGFTQNGTIRFNSDNFTSWSSAEDPGAADSDTGYWIYIKRTRVRSPGTVALTTAKILAATEYTWDKTGAVNVLSLTTATSVINDTTPSLDIKDSDATAGDINAQILAAATDTGDGSEDVDVSFKQQIAGALTDFLVSDADGSMTIGFANQAVAFNTSAVTGISSLTATTITDGTASLTGGDWTSIGSLTATTLTDGTASLSSGALSAVTTLGMGGNLTNYEDVNDGSPEFLLGSSSAEQLEIQSVYTSGAKLLDYVLFKTTEASSTADRGQYKFQVDGTEIARIDDGGLELGVASTTTGGVALYHASSANATTINPGNAVEAVTYTLPTRDGNHNDVMVTSGSGVLSFQKLATYGFAGGGNTGAMSNVIDYFDSSLISGNATDRGDLTLAREVAAATVSGELYGFFTGGNTGAASDVVDYVDITIITGNAADKGDLTVARYYAGGYQGTTYGYTCGGTTGAVSDVIDYINITTTSGNSTDRGNLTVARQACAGVYGTTYGYTCGGTTGAASDVIDYTDLVSTSGNATDRGNLSVARYYFAGVSGEAYGFCAGGYTGVVSDVIDYMDITLTSGNATDRGNLTVARYLLGGVSGRDYGHMTGGNGPHNVIDYWDMNVISGNATDRGDLTAARHSTGGVA